MTRYVILGTGVAAISAAEEIRAHDPGGEIHLIGDDPFGYYSRPGLAYYLTGELNEEMLYPYRKEDYQKLRLLYYRAHAARILPAEKQVELDNGARLPYDKLLIATGAHVSVACAQCHKNNTYKGTPTECAACHAEPVYHLGMFPGQACSQCHNTTAWRPAPYNGPHTFPMTHGQEKGRINTCSTCHQPTLAQWTCYTCHDQAKVTKKHTKEGITNFSDCMRCHPTGREHEGGDHEGGGDDD